jgi:uncharacterized protein YecE (DUF72 family)
MAQLFVGTSGWNYRNWRGSFYPEKLAAKKYLGFYAQHFRSAEVNYSFYHLPRVETYENWFATVPDDFVFALKLSRFITHIKRLNDVKDPWREFLKGARSLKHKLGPILLQFPPSFKGNDEISAASMSFSAMHPKPACASRWNFVMSHVSRLRC